MHNEHGWKETTEDGGKREVRAVKFGGQWRVKAKLKGDDLWTYYDPPLLSDLETLHDVLFRKAQRRRATEEDVEWIAKLIRDRKGD